MNRVNIILAVSLIGVASIAQAGGPGRGQHNGNGFQGGNSFQDWARVTNVQPAYERVNVPQQQCTNEVVYDQQGGYRSDSRSLGGVVIGGLAGGLLGNQVGGGSGKTAATAAGAVVGAIVGDRISNDGYRGGQQMARGREVQRCYTVDQWENRLSGYDVTYEYNGRRYTRLMQQHPGNRVRVNVSVSPV